MGNNKKMRQKKYLLPLSLNSCSNHLHINFAFDLHSLLEFQKDLSQKTFA